MPKKLAAISPLDEAKDSYQLRLQALTDGQLRRERIKLGTKPADCWELELWRNENGRRVAPGWG